MSAAIAARKVRISKATVDQCEPAAARYTAWDTDLKGFGVRVTPQGTKTYVARYRVGGGRSGTLRQFVIGRHGTVTPEQARADAKIILADATRREDPQGDRASRRAELTLAKLCDLYLEEGCATKKPSTLHTDKSRIDRHVRPLLGSRRLSTLKRADIERFLQDVATGKTALVQKTKKRGKSVVRGGKGAATRTVGLLGAILEFAVGRGLLALNPARGVERYKDNQSQRFLTGDEMGRLGSTLATIKANAHALNIIRLLALTGARRSEIEGLCWSEIDLPNSCLRLADSKTGARVLPIGAAAVVVIEALSRSNESPFVFPSADDPTKHFMGTPKVWLRVRKAAKLEGARLHDLRHHLAGLGASGGYSLPIIGAILGHRDAKTTRQYAHLSDTPVKLAADKMAQDAANALAGVKP